MPCIGHSGHRATTTHIVAPALDTGRGMWNVCRWCREKPTPTPIPVWLQSLCYPWNNWMSGAKLDLTNSTTPGRKSLIIQDLRHLYQYSTKYVAHIPSRQCTFLKGYLVQTYSRFVYIYPSSAGVSILKDIGCIHTRNMHQYTLL